MVKTVMMMLSNQRQKWTGCIWWLCCSMLISLGQSWGQSFAERLQAGETIEVEWIQQSLKERNTTTFKLTKFRNKKFILISLKWR